MRCHYRKISNNGKRMFCFLTSRPFVIEDVLDDIITFTFEIGRDTTIIFGLFGFAIGVEFRF